MTKHEMDDIDIRASHPHDNPRLRVWVAADEHGYGHALAVFVAFLPYADSPRAYDRDTYTVTRARRMGIATRLINHATAALAAEPIPRTRCFNWIATEAGYNLAVSLGAVHDEDRPLNVVNAGLPYTPYNQAKADDSGYQALREAAARLGLSEPER
ncbi:GNAT family N-acetyltransferase [Nocardia sp. NPDC019395]|uniref:GNAT family N-acetyltransferase n=1 Tax=Nocardia sp. NPDC019395 TaxID=3154686 RepID=UPI0033C0D46B